MKELLYIEIPTRDTAAVRSWLQAEFEPGMGQRAIAPSGIRLQIFKSTTSGTNISDPSEKMLGEISAFIWSVQRTTYLKVFRWADKPLPGEQQILQRLTNEIRSKFPHNYPEPPAIDLSQQSIFAALAPHYPLTVKYFQKMPNGEYDLTRVYWWEQRWREGVRNPQQPRQVVFSHGADLETRNFASLQSIYSLLTNDKARSHRCAKTLTYLSRSSFSRKSSAAALSKSLKMLRICRCF